MSARLFRHAGRRGRGRAAPRADARRRGARRPGRPAGAPLRRPGGQLLFRAIDALGWPREALFVTNAVKHFKFELRGKRRLHKTPSQREAAACLHWLEDEIGLVEPRAAIALAPLRRGR